MARNQEERELRELKRGLKRLGNKRVRRQSKRLLDEDPEEAHLFNNEIPEQYQTNKYNGMLGSSKKKKKEKDE